MTEPLLVLDSVSKAFGGVLALAGVSLVVPDGGIVAVVGPNGSGKTTLLDIITGIHQPDAGLLSLAGTPLGTLRPDRAAAAGIGRTFDPPRPFGALSVLDTIAVAALLHEPDPTEARRNAAALVGQLALTPFAHAPSAALDLPERRRVELGRALATWPRVLVLDEPLGGLDEADCTATIALLLALNRRRRLAMLVTAHEVGQVTALTDRILFLEQGEVAHEP